MDAGALLSDGELDRQYNLALDIAMLGAEIDALKRLAQRIGDLARPYRNSADLLKRVIRTEIDHLAAENDQLAKQVEMLRLFVKTTGKNEDMLKEQKEEMKRMMWIGGAGVALLPILGYAYGTKKRRGH